MLRSAATRSLIKGFSRGPVARSSYSAASGSFRNAITIQKLSKNRPQAIQSIARPTTISLLYATKPDIGPISAEHVKEVLGTKIEAHPKDVSLGSSVRHVFEGGPEKNKEDDMLAGVKSDLETIKDTFSLHAVPKESLYIGAAGVVPYAVTSASTVFLAYDINHAHRTGSGLLFDPATAHQLLDLITPVQIGFGAVIISFLGAIHWGLEYAGYGGYHSYRRYILGVAAPAIAWPTMLMPVEYALITQFFAFNAMYFADARATVRGWCPEWYSTYRFVLTFVVGASIVFSLVGRGQIVSADSRLKSSVDYVKEDRDSQWEALEREEKQRIASLAKDEDEDEEEKESEDEDNREGEDKEDDKKDDEKSEKKDDKK